VNSRLSGTALEQTGIGVSDERRLRDKLEKLAAEGTGDGAARRLEASGERDMLRAILEEVDETMLPRTLIFRADDGAILRLEAANRRLLGVADVTRETHGSAMLPLLAPDDDGALATVASVLRSFATGRTGLTVTVAPLARGSGPGNRGRAANAVGAALGLELYRSDARLSTSDSAQGFDAGLARAALAIMEISGGQPLPAGGSDPSAVARLAKFDREALAPFAEVLGPAGGGGFLLLMGEVEALFIGEKPSGSTVVALLPAERAGAVAALWQGAAGD
jgi:hypothetical protein